LVDQEYFNKITGVVIDKLEGGYLHPDMKLPPVFRFSGETMFGLDRFAGHDYYYSTPRKADTPKGDLKYIYNGSYKYKTKEAQEFWETIDKAGARKNWIHGYLGGSLNPKLKILASNIIYPFFLKFSDLYFDQKTKDIVFKDPKLTFLFSYSVWNGQGYFQKFANVLDNAVRSGITNPEKLKDIVLTYRINYPNGVISKGGRDIKKFIDTIDLTPPDVKKKFKFKYLIAGSLLIGSFFLIKKYK
jgi:hypothetical protein